MLRENPNPNLKWKACLFRGGNGFFLELGGSNFGRALRDENSPADSRGKTLGGSLEGSPMKLKNHCKLYAYCTRGAKTTRQSISRVPLTMAWSLDPWTHLASAAPTLFNQLA